MHASPLQGVIDHLTRFHGFGWFAGDTAHWGDGERHDYRYSDAFDRA